MMQVHLGSKIKNIVVMECINIYVLVSQKKEINVERLLGKMKRLVIFIKPINPINPIKPIKPINPIKPIKPIL
jgi:hypothetical protein